MKLFLVNVLIFTCLIPYAVFASSNLDVIIGKDPAFQEWIKKAPKINVKQVQFVANNLTLGEVEQISKHNGIAHIEVNSGCFHKCIGCLLRCDIKAGMKRMSWENFKKSIEGLEGLQQALDEIYPNKYILVSKTWLSHYLGSDPMNNRVVSADHTVKNTVDLMKLNHKLTSHQIDIWTAGWSPYDKVLQDAAIGMVGEIKADKASYISSLDLEIKAFTKHFQVEVEKEMSKIMLANSEFIEKFEQEFRKYGFNFLKYSEPNEVLRLYFDLVNDNYTEVIASSKYMQDRIKNLKLFLHSINTSDKVRLVFYKATSGKTNSLPNSLRPFMNAKKLTTHIDDHYLNKKLNWSKVRFDLWSFDETDGKLVTEAEYPTSVVLKYDGSISLNTKNHRTFFMTQSDNKFIRSLAYKPIFFKTNQPLWKRASAHLDITGEPYISKNEALSIKLKIKRDNKIHPNNKIIVNDKVYFPDFNGKKDVPFVRISIDKKEYLVELRYGRMVERNMINHEQIPTISSECTAKINMFIK